MKTFVPCPQCKRHILTSDSACPFCHTPLPDDFGPTPRVVAPAAVGPFARAAILFMGAATSACSGPASSQPVPQPFYGPAVVDASMDQDSGEPMPVPFYGPAVVDASPEAAGPDASADSGEPIPTPFYGPAVVDSGSHEE